MVNVNDLDYSQLTFKSLPRRPGENGKMVYADAVCCFDIESTRIEEREQSIM